MNRSGILRRPTAERRCSRPWRPCGRNWADSGLRRPEGLRLTGPLIESRNPGRPDEVVGRLSSASSEDVEQAVRRAVQAWESWRDTTAERRAGHHACRCCAHADAAR